MNHKTFMALFDDLPEGPRNYVELAYILAKDGHRSQSRKTGERYWEHPRRVALILIQELGIKSWAVICAALLHDTVEDTLYIHWGNLKQWFGPIEGKWIATTVYDLTRKARVDHRDEFGQPYLPKRTTDEYYERLACREKGCAALIKGADSLDNVRSLTAEVCSPDFQRRTIKKARRILAILKEHAAHDFWDGSYGVLAELLETAIAKQEKVEE